MVSGAFEVTTIDNVAILRNSAGKNLVANTQKDLSDFYKQMMKVSPFFVFNDIHTLFMWSSKIFRRKQYYSVSPEDLLSSGANTLQLLRNRYGLENDLVGYTTHDLLFLTYKKIAKFIPPELFNLESRLIDYHISELHSDNTERYLDSLQQYIESVQQRYGKEKIVSNDKLDYLLNELKNKNTANLASTLDYIQGSGRTLQKVGIETWLGLLCYDVPTLEDRERKIKGIFDEATKNHAINYEEYKDSFTEYLVLNTSEIEKRKNEIESRVFELLPHLRDLKQTHEIARFVPESGTIDISDLVKQLYEVKDYKNPTMEMSLSSQEVSVNITFYITSKVTEKRTYVLTDSIGETLPIQKMYKALDEIKIFSGRYNLPSAYIIKVLNDSLVSHEEFISRVRKNKEIISSNEPELKPVYDFIILNYKPDQIRSFYKPQETTYKGNGISHIVFEKLPLEI